MLAPKKLYQHPFLQGIYYVRIVLSKKASNCLISSVQVCITPQIYSSNFGPLGLDHFESWPDSNKWPKSFDKVPHYLKENQVALKGN